MPLTPLLAQSRAVAGELRTPAGRGVSARQAHSRSTGALGRINLAAPTSGSAGFLNSVSKANLNVVFDVSVDKVATGGGAMVNLIVRHVGTTDYRYKVRFMADGTVHLVISEGRQLDRDDAT